MMLIDDPPSVFVVLFMLFAISEFSNCGLTPSELGRLIYKRFSSKDEVDLDPYGAYAHYAERILICTGDFVTK